MDVYYVCIYVLSKTIIETCLTVIGQACTWLPFGGHVFKSCFARMALLTLYFWPYSITCDANPIHTSLSLGKVSWTMISDHLNHVSLNGSHICFKLWLNFLHECYITQGHVHVYLIIMIYVTFLFDLHSHSGWLWVIIYRNVNKY